MGTNFYIRGHRHCGSMHIGKRSAAGYYCWHCKMTLGIGDDWVESCPGCGRLPESESLADSAAGLELGFANPKVGSPKVGVRSCSSFRWAMTMDDVKAKMADATKCPSCHREYTDCRECRIEDEYGRLYTSGEFESMLAGCPVQFFDSIGKEFS